MARSSVLVVVLVTCPDEGSALRIAGELLDGRLAACVNVISGLRSFFWWEGKVEEALEALLIIKTRSSLLGELTKRIRELHPYEVPEVIALPIVGGSEDYMEWVKEETKAGKRVEGPGG